MILFSSSIGDVNFPGLTPTTIDNMTIGGTTPAPITASQFKLDTGTKTATAVSGAATLNKMSGTITSEALTTAVAGFYTLTLTNSAIALGDLVFATVQNGTNTQSQTDVCSCLVTAGQVVITVQNVGATLALNGTIKVGFMVVKA